MSGRLQFTGGCVLPPIPSSPICRAGEVGGRLGSTSQGPNVLRGGKAEGLRKDQAVGHLALLAGSEPLAGLGKKGAQK